MRNGGDGGGHGLVERGDVGDALVVADDDDLGALSDGPPVVAARPGTAPRAFERVDDLSRSTPFADGHRHLRDRAGEDHRLQRTLPGDDHAEEAAYDRAAGETADGGDSRRDQRGQL